MKGKLQGICGKAVCSHSNHPARQLCDQASLAGGSWEPLLRADSQNTTVAGYPELQPLSSVSHELALAINQLRLLIYQDHSAQGATLPSRRERAAFLS